MFTSLKNKKTGLISSLELINPVLFLFLIIPAWCPCCSVTWKLIGNYPKYKKSNQYISRLTPCKTAPGLTLAQFLIHSSKANQSQFRIRNVGFHHAKIFLFSFRSSKKLVNIQQKFILPIFFTFLFFFIFL